MRVLALPYPIGLHEPDHPSTRPGETWGIDVGGATTDVYSALQPRETAPDAVAGVLWQVRTVEGDLGVRWNTAGILDGISRKSVIQIAEDLGYTVVERDISRSELYVAEEAFLVGTAAELVPVREIDDRDLGEPGEITRVLAAKYEDALHGRAQEYLEWLDIVEQQSKVTS